MQEIVLTKNQKDKISFYAKMKTNTANLEECQKNDTDSFNRFYNGGAAECAIVEALGFNWSPFTYGGGMLNGIPDLIGFNLNIGIKSCEVGKSLRIPITICSDEICCKFSKFLDIIYPIGICTQEHVNKYGDVSLLYGGLKESGKPKTGFNRFDTLMSIPNNLFEKYTTSILSYSKLYVSDLKESCVYIERINYDYIIYVDVVEGQIGSPVFVKFPYKEDIKNTVVDKEGVLKLFDLLIKRKNIISMGMTSVLYQLKVYNENINEKRSFQINCIDLFEIATFISKEWGSILDYNSCLYFLGCTEKNLSLLYKQFYSNDLICKEGHPLSRNCFYSLICYFKMIKKLQDIYSVSDMEIDKLNILHF